MNSTEASQPGDPVSDPAAERRSPPMREPGDAEAGRGDRSPPMRGPEDTATDPTAEHRSPPMREPGDAEPGRDDRSPPMRAPEDTDAFAGADLLDPRSPPMRGPGDPTGGPDPDDRSPPMRGPDAWQSDAFDFARHGGAGAFAIPGGDGGDSAPDLSGEGAILRPPIDLPLPSADHDLADLGAQGFFLTTAEEAPF